MPDDVAQEKVQALHALGADVIRVRPASIVDKKQFVVSVFQAPQVVQLDRPTPEPSS
jgi:cysteine synthase